MRWLKLFEDYEDKFYRILDTLEFNTPILMDENTLGSKLFTILKNKLGADYSIYNNFEDYFYITSKEKPFLWKIIALQEDFFLVRRIFLLDTEEDIYAECDGIKGILNFIEPTVKFDAKKIYKDLFYKYDVASKISGSVWSDMPKIIAANVDGYKLYSDIRKMQYSFDKTAYPIDEFQSMLDTVKKEVSFKVKKSNLGAIPEFCIGAGLTQDHYDIFEIYSDEYKDFQIFFYYVKDFNLFCVLHTSFNKYTSVYKVFSLEGFKSLLVRRF